MGENIILLTKGRCNLLPSQTQYLHKESWETLSMKNGSLEITVKEARVKVHQILRTY